MRRSIYVLVVSLGLLALPASAAAAPPANDDYANAATISTMNADVAGTNSEATMQSMEPDFGGDGTGSVWYTWTAPSSEKVQIHTCNGSGLDTIIEVFTASGGSPPGSGLTLIGASDQFCGNQSLVQFNAVSATTYKIQVMGFDGDEGPFVLRVSDQLPTVTIDSGPGTTTSSTPTWTFHSDMTAALFDCAFFEEPSDDFIGDELCSSPYTPPVAFPPGSYEFDVLTQTPTGEVGIAQRPFTVQSQPGGPSPPPAAGITGLRAAALAKCKKKHSARARRKCRRRAKALPLAHFPGLLAGAR
jgi:hypothetical protein